MGGMCEILDSMVDDSFLKHLNLTRNITAEEAAKPSAMQKLHAHLRKALKANKSLTAIDLAYNHLFDNTKHPTNEHVHDYMIELTNTLAKSKIVRLDISGNYLCGKGGREYTGILYLVRNFCCKGGLKALRVRDNRLHSQGCAAVSEGLGVYSKLEELDLSDNFLGLDPTGRFNSEGMMLLSRQISQTLGLRRLRLSRNSLRDEDITHLAEAVCSMPKLQELDISGNHCTGIGMVALKQAIISHSALVEDDEGLHTLNMSHNNLGENNGAQELCEALLCTLTLEDLGLKNNNFSKEDMILLQETLANNSTVQRLDCSDNYSNVVIEGGVMAEVQGLVLAYSLRKNHMAVDTTKLKTAVYKAMSLKLRFLSSGVLQLLYENPSFLIENSDAREALELYEPPGRQYLLKAVYARDPEIQSRLSSSHAVHKKVAAVHKIFHCVMRWWAVIRKAKELEKRLKQSRDKAAAESMKNEESAF